MELKLIKEEQILELLLFTLRKSKQINQFLFFLFTFLIFRCELGHTEIVKLLHSRGADVNQARTDIGATPLFVACQKGHKDIALFLIDNGADVNKARFDLGAHPLYIA